MIWDAVWFKDFLGVLVVGLVASPPGSLINQWIRGTCIPGKVTAQEARCSLVLRVE